MIYFVYSYCSNPEVYVFITATICNNNAWKCMIFVLLIIFLCLLFRLFPLSSFLQYSSVTLYHFVFFCWTKRKFRITNALYFYVNVSTCWVLIFLTMIVKNKVLEQYNGKHHFVQNIIRFSLCNVHFVQKKTILILHHF